MKKKICKICNKQIPKTSQGKYYCSKKCRYQDHSNIIKNSYTKELKTRKSRIQKEVWNKNIRHKTNLLQQKLDKETIQNKLPYAKRRVSQEFVCKQCYKKFLCIPTDRDGIFCSKKCYINFSKENSSYYRTKAFSLLPNKCDICEEINDLIVHHKDSNHYNNDITNLQILCNRCHRWKHHGESLKSRNSKFKDGKILRAFRDILDGLRLDPNDPNLKDTPYRVLKGFYEIFEGINNNEEIKKLFKTSFPSTYHGMVVLDNIKVFSMCPHHFLPVEYVVHVGYISKNKMIGISKLPRLVQLLARKPELQETFTKQICDILQKNLKADGVMVIVYGKHNCMRMRGIEKPDAGTITSSISGIFKTDRSAKQEFMELIKLNKKIQTL